MIVAVGVEYLGTRYCGWQKQLHSPSVQSCVEQALSKVANHPVTVFCAGRTDTGVHALGQVIHFETDSKRPEKAWILGGNAHLPDDISINWARPMPDNFHARFSAQSRRYHYIILNRRPRPAVLTGQVTWIRDPLDEKAMHTAAQSLVGEQDFSSFQAASCQSPTAFRNIFHINVIRRNDFVLIDVTANAFLHHMVRNIAGTLIDVGRGIHSVDWVKQLLEKKDRTKASPTASPSGLYFLQANYSRQLNLPTPNSSFGPFD